MYTLYVRILIIQSDSGAYIIRYVRVTVYYFIVFVSSRFVSDFFFLPPPHLVFLAKSGIPSYLPVYSTPAPVSTRLFMYEPTSLDGGGG